MAKKDYSKLEKIVSPAVNRYGAKALACLPVRSRKAKEGFSAAEFRFLLRKKRRR
jgi:hypothetical protein